MARRPFWRNAGCSIKSILLASFISVSAIYVLSILNIGFTDSLKLSTAARTGILQKDILNDTLGVFVLNLPSRTDRRDALALSARLSDIQLSWVSGVSGDDISDKALPPGERKGLSNGGKGSWRGHMNAIRTVVEENLGSALIMEDDVDWDVRIKTQLQEFALASQAFVQDAEEQEPSNPGLPEQMNSPYGPHWDLAWLGHCGTSFRSESSGSRVLIENDITVPQPQYLKPHPFAALDDYGKLHPPHTRIVHQPKGASCSLAYALTQRGARKLLYEFGVKSFDKQIDFMLGDFCDNIADINGTRDGVGRAQTEGRCTTVQPPLFSHHYPEGASSDIYATGGGMVKMVGTLYVRWSVRMNLARLIKGETTFVDQWPDIALP